ncbi:hypothetical protein Tco_0328030 [Tanacetum coccineum]
MERYKAEVLDVEGAPECMKISGFMHGITHPGLIKRLYERIPRSMDEMYRMTTSFLQGEVAAFSHGQRKASSSWKQSEGGGGEQTEFQERLQKQTKTGSKPDMILNRSPKRQKKFRAGKGKFNAPPPLDYPKLLSGDIDFLSTFGERRRNGGTNDKDAAKWRALCCTGNTLTAEHYSESLCYEHCFVLTPAKVRVQMFTATLSPYRIQWRDHLATGPNSLVSQNRPGIRKIRVVPSTAHVMLKFPVKGGTITLQSSRVIPMECAMISGPSIQSPAVNQVPQEKINIAIHPENPEQTVAIGKRKEDRHRKEIRIVTITGNRLEGGVLIGVFLYKGILDDTRHANTPVPRVHKIPTKKQRSSRESNLDSSIEEVGATAIKKQKVRKRWKNITQRVRGTSFKPDDMVYRNNEASHARDEGKLGPNWKGPYKVKESLGKGAYKSKMHRK